MEEKSKSHQAPNKQKTVECTKCHKQVVPTNGILDKSGFICNECVVKQKKRKRNIIAGSCASVVAATCLCGGIYMCSPENRTGVGFDGVGEITDSMNVVVDSAIVAFNMATATATSDPVSTQNPISNIAEFKAAISKNVGDAQKSNKQNVVIPSIGVRFEINTNYFVLGNNEIVKELAKTYLQTNKQATILVEGYTCDLGGDQLNQKLSELRADAVKKILIETGVPSDKIETKWYGKSRYKEFNYPNKSDYRRVIVSIK